MSARRNEKAPLPAVEPMLWTAARAAALVGTSVRTWWRLHATGKTPPSVRVGSLHRWQKDVIVAWIKAGCPDRKTWLNRAK